ncbi:hypothetical protein Mycsm_07076 (plasmid) [Mycobacterium sp. JS623]|nr:hypothetical protein Mycsm_07076 [Mycobacterium sp. JS623]
MSRHSYPGSGRTWRNAESLGAANEHRRRDAASRQSARARAALEVLTSVNLSRSPVWRRRWLEVLQRRAADDQSSLADLAAKMSPPMTKSAFSCQLDRACLFAEELAAAANRAPNGSSSTTPIAVHPSAHDSLEAAAAPVGASGAAALPVGGHR